MRRTPITTIYATPPATCGLLDVPAEEFVRHVQLHVGRERHGDIVAAHHPPRTSSSHLRLQGQYSSDQLYLAKQRTSSRRAAAKGGGGGEVLGSQYPIPEKKQMSAVANCPARRSRDVAYLDDHCDKLAVDCRSSEVVST